MISLGSYEEYKEIAWNLVGSALHPDILNLRLYDLVTATDAAGNPIERTHFEFRIQRVAGRL